MTGSWNERPLSEVVGLRRGYDLPTSDRKPGPFPVISAGTTIGTHSESKVKGPGFAIGRATNLGVPQWSDNDFWPLNTTLYAEDYKGNNRRWLFHLFQVLDLTGYNSGSVQPMLNRNYIASIPVRVPPRFEQDAIAEVLGALDDKIAANRRIIDGGIALIDAHYARASKHRGNVTFRDVADLGGGGTPSTKDDSLWNGKFRWATPTDVTGLDGPWLLDTGRHISDAGLDHITSKLYPRHTVIMTSRASIGFCAFLSEPTAVNQGFIAVQAKEDQMRTWLFAQLRNRTKEFVAWANGATFLELPKGIFRGLPVDLPAGSELDSFNRLAAPVLERAEAAQIENTVLASARDELLPLLMNGRISVTDAEHRVSQEV